MDKLLSFLKTVPEYSALLTAIENGESAAVTGIGQINRSHLISGMCSIISKPIVLICQDDIAA